MKTATVLLIESRLLVANQLALIVRSRGHRCLLVRSSVPAGLRVAAEEQVDVLVVPVGDGAHSMRNTAQFLAEHSPKTRLIVTSQTADTRLLRQAQFLGTAGFVAADRSGQRLMEAVTQSLAGGGFYAHCPAEPSGNGFFNILMHWPSLLTGDGTPVP